MDGDFSTITDKTGWLNSCTAALSVSTNKCEDVRAGSVIVTISAESISNLDSEFTNIETNGLTISGTSYTAATTTTAQATTTTAQATAGGCAVGQKKDKCGVCGGNGNDKNCGGSCDKKDDICTNVSYPCPASVIYDGTPQEILVESYQFGKCKEGTIVTCSSAGNLIVDRYEKDNCDSYSKKPRVYPDPVPKNACIEVENRDDGTRLAMKFSWSGRCGGDEGTDFPASTNTTSKGSAAGLTTFFAFALALMISML